MHVNSSDRDVIIACSSGFSKNSAIAVIRLSGFDNLQMYQNYLSLNVNKIKPKRAYITNILDKGRIVDECVLLFFKSPNSYTGENVLELNVHGNILNIKKILDLLTQEENTRLALPGEFTRRALQNNKLNLTQVEGIDLILNAKNHFALRKGQDLLNGKIAKIYKDLYEKYVELKSALEIAIDFAEDVGEIESEQNINNKRNELSLLVEELFIKSQNSPSQLLNPDVVLLGSVNAGKSTLFNMLFSCDRSIVSHEAGTTRDFISEEVHINGSVFRIIDTAGIRETNNNIEAQGVERAKQLVKSAFFRILVINANCLNKNNVEMSQDVFDAVVISHAENKIEKDLVEVFLSQRNFKNVSCPIFVTSLINVSDMAGPIGASFYVGPIGAGVISGPIGPLRNLIFELVAKKFEQYESEDFFVLERHKNLVSKIRENLCKFNSLYKSENDIAILATSVYTFGHWIEELIGVVSAENILNSIFDNFCIGK